MQRGSPLGVAGDLFNPSETQLTNRDNYCQVYDVLPTFFLFGDVETYSCLFPLLLSSITMAK